MEDQLGTGALERAEALFEEVIAAQRELVAQYAVPTDKFDLVKLLQEEANYLLGQHSKADSTLQADALLTEAIQLCRALAAEFPDSADYKSRLADLLKLQAQHFGQEKQRPEYTDK
jgi:hypothetical protein